MIKIFHVKGDSMYPILKDGDIVVCLKIFSFTKLGVGDIVVFTLKSYSKDFIKQISDIQDKKFYLKGLGALSIDSRDFGALSQNELGYKMLFQL